MSALIKRTCDLLPAELLENLLRLADDLEKATVEFSESAYEYAVADTEYRKAKAISYLTAVAEDKPKPRKEMRTIPALEATRDIECEAERFRERMAKAQKEACRESLEAKRAHLSAYQSVVGALKAEIELTGRGPNQNR